MIRRAAAPTLTPKAFKHFAVITIGITACIGLFSNGEEAERLAKSLESQQREAATQVSTAVQQRVKPVAKLNAQFQDARRSHLPLAGELEEVGNFGQPMDGSSFSIGSGSASEPVGGFSVGTSPRAGIGEAIPLDVASATTKPGDLPTSRRSPGQQRRPTRKQLEQLEAASAARSGGT